MNVVQLFGRYAQAPVSSERTFPANPFPRKHVHCALNSLEDAVEAVFALRVAGLDAIDIHVLACWDFVEAAERVHRHRNGFFHKMLNRLYAFMDEGFAGIYLREACQGHHILLVRLPGKEQLEQVSELLTSHRAYLIKYVDTWTVTDLLPCRHENTSSYDA